ncbi:hypothetical protein TNCV_4796551 [Trichonephila clavipes]|nr:hypothetical protein TNCV_4796551 [Trichonephila clavipes]
MPPQRNKEKFQQLMEFERGRIISLREGGFSYRATGPRIPGAIFQQHNARPHVAKIVRDFRSSQHMQLLPWPAYSPNMPSIEHLWHLVGRRLVRDPRPAASKDELLLRIQAVFNSLPQAEIQNLFDCLPRRIAALIAARTDFGYLILLFFALKISSYLFVLIQVICALNVI